VDQPDDPSDIGTCLSARTATVRLVLWSELYPRATLQSRSSANRRSCSPDGKTQQDKRADGTNVSVTLYHQLGQTGILFEGIRNCRDIFPSAEPVAFAFLVKDFVFWKEAVFVYKQATELLEDSLRPQGALFAERRRLVA